MELLLIIIIFILLGWFWPVVGFLAFVFGGILILWLLVTIIGGLFSFLGTLFLDTKKQKKSITEGYCIKCKVKREMNNPKETTMKGMGGRTMMAMTGPCSICGTKMFRIKKVKPDSNINNLTITNDNSPNYEYFDRVKEYEPPNEEVKELMENHDLDQDEADEVKELMDETGLDEDDAVELKDAL